jgi:hypothetical protein
MWFMNSSTDFCQGHDGPAAGNSGLVGDRDSGLEFSDELFGILAPATLSSHLGSSFTRDVGLRLRIAYHPSPLIPEEPCADGKGNLATAHAELQTLTIRISLLIFSTCLGVADRCLDGLGSDLGILRWPVPAVER